MKTNSMIRHTRFATTLAAGLMATVMGCGNPAVQFPLDELPDSGADLQAPSCSDHVKNGAETDVDCGGGQCAPCSDQKSCNDPSDCVSKVCINHICQPPTCTDVPPTSRRYTARS